MRELQSIETPALIDMLAQVNEKFTHLPPLFIIPSKTSEYQIWDIQNIILELFKRNAFSNKDQIFFASEV
jgi:hypothetical protein